MAKTKLREKQVVDADFLSEQEFAEAKGAVNGVAPLDENAKVPCEYLHNCVNGPGDISWLFNDDGKIKCEFIPQYCEEWNEGTSEWGEQTSGTGSAVEWE